METDANNSWYKIAESLAEINFTANGLAASEVAGKTITIGIHGSEVFACTQKCPHAGGILAEGYIDALGHIVCPLHHYKFSLQNGRNVSGEGYKLKTFPVEIRSDGIYLQLNSTDLFGNSE